MYKKIDQHVLSIGFPASVFDKLKTEFVVEIFETYSSFTTTENNVELDYKNWRKEIIDNQISVSKEINEKQIIAQLKNYPLANKTPIEVFVWVANLQKQM